ncbi:MAG TPA: glycosyltransferase family 87 protein [Alphaproteobacteria bacterium]
MNASATLDLTGFRTRCFEVAWRLFFLLYPAAMLLGCYLYDDIERLMARDFLAFWSASYLAWIGDPAAAYDQVRILAVERFALPGGEALYLWHYPPTFQLFVLPLSLLPYFAAFAVWVALTLAAYLIVIGRLAAHAYAPWLALAFPAAFMNVFLGQNGFLSAALFGGALALLKTQPALAGVLFGLLSYKPQLGLLVPLALLCGRQWTAFCSASVTTLVFAGASVAVLGVEPWIAFFDNIPKVAPLLDNGWLPWVLMPSVYVGLRTIGLDAAHAYAIHIIVAAVVAGTVAWVWRGRAPLHLAGAVLAAGAVLMSPYLFHYDLALLAVPIAILAAEGIRQGRLVGENGILILAWLTPLATFLLAVATGIQVAPLCLLGLFFIAARRACAARRLPIRHVAPVASRDVATQASPAAPGGRIA